MRTYGPQFKDNSKDERLESSVAFWDLVANATPTAKKETKDVNKKYVTGKIYTNQKLTYIKQKKVIKLAENILFEDMNFAHTTIHKITFRDCIFRRCQFNHTIMEYMYLHDCKFIDCNFYKAKVKETYVDPKSFSKSFDPTSETNMGTHWFQQLMKNFKNMDQPEFLRQADFLFMRWKRRELWYKVHTSENIWVIGLYLSKIFKGFLYQWTLGYGIKLRHFAISSLVIFLFFWVINTLNWQEFGLQEVCQPCQIKPWLNSLYYTTVSLSNLGYGDITPTTLTGRMWASGQAIVGAIMFAIMASIIFKKLSR